MVELEKGKQSMLHPKHYRVGHIANQPMSKGHLHDYYKEFYTQTTLKFYHWNCSSNEYEYTKLVNSTLSWNEGCKHYTH